MQPPFIYTTQTVDAIEKGLSTDRLAPYVRLAQGDREQAIKLYLLNTSLSEAIYSPAQSLEVLLRNRIHEILSAVYGSTWYATTGPGLTSGDLEQISKVTAKLQTEGKTVTPSRIVAGLSFGFWVSLFASRHNPLWMNHFHRLFRTQRGGLQRKVVHEGLIKVRDLRNRVAHHEPILAPDLEARCEAIFKAIGWLCTETEGWSRAHSRFEGVWQSPDNPHHPTPSKT